MFYSSFLKSIPGLLAQPFSIAVIASSGIHAIAGVAVPSFYSGSQPEEPQPVSLLSSSEINQSGLPNLERPPELSLLNQDQLAELKKKSGNKQQGRTVPKLNRNRYSGSAGTKQGLKKNPSQARKQQRTITPQQLKKIEKEVNEKFAQQGKVNQGLRNQNQQLRNQNQQLRNQNQQLRNQNQRPQGTIQNRDNIKKPNLAPEKQPDNTPVNDNDTSVTTNNTDNERIIDIKGVDDSQVIPPIASNNGTKETPDIPPQVKQALTFQETLTSDNEANQQYLAWGQSVEQNTGQQVAISEPNLSINGNYPQDACLGEEVLGKRVEGKATYGVTVDAEGKIIGEPTLIRSSGFPILNQQARVDIQSSEEFAKNPEPTPYLVEVNYPHNEQVCSKE